ncbi:MAG: YaeQ family protein [Anaeromyxobacteraceae bacterium]
MALPSTLHRFELRIVHADEGQEHEVSLSAARHPSETIERLWLRVVAAGWLWREGLTFGAGLSDPDAPDLVAPTLDGRVALLARVGRPEPARIERDVNQNRGARVAVLFDGPRRLEAFVEEARAGGMKRLAQVELAALEPELLRALAAHDQRRVKATLTFVEGHLYAEVDGEAVDGPLVRAAVEPG